MTFEAKEVTVRGRLHDLNAAIEPGTITAICGPNGAGKSTLLSALAGLLAPDAGLVRLDGEDLAGLAPRERARRIGFLPQEGQVAWDISVRSLVALGRMPHGDRDTAPVEAAIEALSLSKLADRPVSRLSGGERARSLLARVMAGEPAWLLADEPLAALDLGHQLDLLRHLRMTARNGTGVVVVLHDLALAMNHADRVLVLNQGCLAAHGPPAQALSEETIRRIWKVPARGLGEPGARALITS